MELKEIIAQNDFYDVYKSDTGMAVNVYKKPEYKENASMLP